MYVFPSAVESDGCGFNLFGGRPYFSLVLSSLNSPPLYPSEGKSVKLLTNVPLYKTGELFLKNVFGWFLTVKFKFNESPGINGSFNLYISK